MLELHYPMIQFLIIKIIQLSNLLFISKVPNLSVSLPVPAVVLFLVLPAAFLRPPPADFQRSLVRAPLVPGRALHRHAPERHPG